VTLGDVVAACAARLGDQAPSVLARIAGPLGDAARAALPGVQPSKERRAEIAAYARAPASPAQLRSVDASWIESALAELPPRARRALSASDASDPLDVWLARTVTAVLPVIAVDGLPREPAATRSWLRGIALDQIAFAVGATSAAAMPALRDAAARITRPPRAGRLGPQRAAVLRVKDARLDDEASLLGVAARALAPHLVHQRHGIRAIAARLPRDLGLAFTRDVAAFSSTTLDLVPAWEALVES